VVGSMDVLLAFPPLIFALARRRSARASLRLFPSDPDG